MSLILTTATRKLELILDAAPATNNVPITVHSTVVREGDTNEGVYGCELNLSNGTTDVVIMKPPTTGMSKTLRTLTLVNTDTAAITVTIKMDDNGTDYNQIAATLQVGDGLYYEHDVGWSFTNEFGALKQGFVEIAQDSIGGILANSDTILFQYDDGIPQITAEVNYSMSITEAVTTGLQLVNDEDTPGNLEVYGTNSAGTKGWYPTGTKTLYIPAIDMTPQATSGSAALALVASGSGLADIQTLDFDTTVAEYAQFSTVMPRNFSGTITAVFYWSHAATVTNFGVAWNIQALALANDDAISTAWGTAVTAVDTGGTTDDLYISPATSAMTIGNTHADDDLVVFRVYRDPANGGDNLGVDARLHGVQLTYTIDAYGEA